MPEFKVQIEEILKAEYEVTVVAESYDLAIEQAKTLGHDTPLDQKNLRTLDYSIDAEEIAPAESVPPGVKPPSYMIYKEYFPRRDHKPGEYVGFQVEAKFLADAGTDDEEIQDVDDADHYAFLVEEGIAVFWSIYGVVENGMVECLGDFNDPRAAYETTLRLGGRSVKPA